MKISMQRQKKANEIVAEGNGFLALVSPCKEIKAGQICNSSCSKTRLCASFLVIILLNSSTALKIE